MSNKWEKTSEHISYVGTIRHMSPDGIAKAHRHAALELLDIYAPSEKIDAQKVLAQITRYKLMKFFIEEQEDRCLKLGEATKDELRRSELRNLHQVIRMNRDELEDGEFDQSSYISTIDVQYRLDELSKTQDAGNSEIYRKKFTDDGLD